MAGRRLQSSGELRWLQAGLSHAPAEGDGPLGDWLMERAPSRLPHRSHDHRIESQEPTNDSPSPSTASPSRGWHNIRARSPWENLHEADALTEGSADLRYLLTQHCGG